ncbi:MAG TPA: hypothetical protein VHD56_14440 [Tepidisphaeraceae bacterium]|jgi:hypothetical protein|nr:hypothetical protein [Tepidisphaeraceae bacterium]
MEFRYLNGFRDTDTMNYFMTGNPFAPMVLVDPVGDCFLVRRVALNARPTIVHLHPWLRDHFIKNYKMKDLASHLANLVNANVTPSGGNKETSNRSLVAVEDVRSAEG